MLLFLVRFSVRFLQVRIFFRVIISYLESGVFCYVVVIFFIFQRRFCAGYLVQNLFVCLFVFAVFCSLEFFLFYLFFMILTCLARLVILQMWIVWVRLFSFRFGGVRWCFQRVLVVCVDGVYVIQFGSVWFFFVELLLFLAVGACLREVVLR